MICSSPSVFVLFTLTFLNIFSGIDQLFAIFYSYIDTWKGIATSAKSEAVVGRCQQKSARIYFHSQGSSHEWFVMFQIVDFLSKYFFIDYYSKSIIMRCWIVLCFLRAIFSRYTFITWSRQRPFLQKVCFLFFLIRLFSVHFTKILSAPVSLCQNLVWYFRQ